ncbi:DUF6286 domain-containing protein [Mycolicibacterium sp. CR10]|uniref:DUF6286 domain-containing protein n=1 Tax=Mycolicibacterium sp. CR10 TaxID=2562314 RepID=UPI0010C0121E|nr:DUF6286 domain-containing protein [Mycolicibacterium sp. CR10]
MSTLENKAAPAAATAPAKAPVAVPAASAVTLALALALTALGFVAARDVLLSAGAITGSPWIVNALNYLDGLTAQGWMVPAGIAAAVLGLLLVFAAVKPRRRTHQPLTTADAWITTRDLRRVARGAAVALTGVTAATVTGSARKITVAVTPVGGYDTAELTDAVNVAVTKALAPMARPPRVRIRIKEEALP